MGCSGSSAESGYLEFVSVLKLPRSFSAVADAINELEELSFRDTVLAVACFQSFVIFTILDARVQATFESQPQERWSKVLRPH